MLQIVATDDFDPVRYRYPFDDEPFPPTIRLLQIRRVCVDQKEETRIEGMEMSIQVSCKAYGNRAKAYMALSYQWGEERAVQQEKGISIKNDLMRALQKFRQSSTPSAVIWMDAICIEQSGNRHLLRTALAETGETVSCREKGTTALSENISTVIEIAQRRRWPEYLQDFLLSLGQVIVAIPVVLYQSKCRFHETRPDDLPNSHYSCDLGPNLVTHCRRVLIELLSNFLPASLASVVTDPRPSLFISSSVVIGILMTLQYHHKQTSSLTRPFLLVGLTLGCAASLFLHSHQNVALLTGAIAVIPTMTVLSFVFCCIADATCQLLRSNEDRERTLRRILAKRNKDNIAGSRSKGSGVRFITVE